MGSAPTLARGRPGRQIGPPSTSSSSRRWWLQEVLRRIPPAQSELLLLTAMHHDPRQLIVRDHRGPNGPRLLGTRLRAPPLASAPPGLPRRSGVWDRER